MNAARTSACATSTGSNNTGTETLIRTRNNTKIRRTRAEAEALAKGMGGEPYDLGRFVEAQEAVYSRVCQELSGGRKSSHWMWFVFPQLRGLGQSQMAHTYGIASRAEAEAYLKHPVWVRGFGSARG